MLFISDPDPGKLTVMVGASDSYTPSPRSTSDSGSGQWTEKGNNTGYRAGWWGKIHVVPGCRGARR